MSAPLGENLLKTLFETYEFRGYVDSGIRDIAPLLIGAGLSGFVPFLSPLIIAGLTSHLLPKAMKIVGGKIEIANEHLQQYEKEGGSKAILAKVASPVLGVLKKVIPAPEMELHEALSEGSTKLKEFLSAILNDDAKRKEFEDNLKKFLTGSYGSFDEFQRNVKETMGISVDRLAIEAYTQFTNIFYNREILDKIATIAQVPEDKKQQIEARLEGLRSEFDRNFRKIEKEIEGLREDFRQNYGLVRLHHNYFEDYKQLEQDKEDWKKGFSFKLESIKENLEFRRTKVIDSIEKKLENQGGVLIVGPRGYSKTTFFYEIICDYYDRGYEILYNEGAEIRNGYGLQEYIEELLKDGNKVLVAVDNAHTSKTAAIFFVMDRLLGLNYELRKNLKCILTARHPDIDRLIKDRLEEIDEICQGSVRKFAGEAKEGTDTGFRFPLPSFEPDEIKAFYRFYNDIPSIITADEQFEQELNIYSNEIFRQTNGHPILVKYVVLGYELSKHVEDIYRDHLKNNENKLKTLLVCGLLDISVIPINKDLLEKMGILTYAQDLEGIALRQEESADGSLWKTFHSEWDVELLSFLYNQIKAGEELKRRIMHLEKAIKSIFDIGNEQITSSVIRSLYYITDDKRLPIDIVESVISKHIAGHYFSNKTKCYLYSVVMAFAYANLGRNEEAIEKCEEALSIDEKYAPAWNNKGAALGKLGRYEEAIPCFDRAIKLNPNDAGVRNNKANALRHLNRNKEAIKCVDKALELDANDAQAWNNKGLILSGLGKFEEAIEQYSKAIELDANAAAWQNKANALDDLRRYEEAIKCYTTAIKLNPNDAYAWNNKGVSLYRLGKYEEAIKCYDRSIEINPNNAETWNNKGVSLRKLDRYEEAIKCYTTAIKLNPNDAGVWNNKGEALYRLYKYEEAIACYNKALDINPKHAFALYLRACFKIKKGDSEGGLVDLKKAIEIDKSFIESAREEKDFDSIRNDVRFKAVLIAYENT